MADKQKGTRRVLVLHGPNLNLLGKREVGIYGSKTLADIDRHMRELGRKLDMEVETFQSNHEGRLVDRIQAAVGDFQAIIINPAAYTHTSIAIRDAILAVEIPVIEVHLSNIHKREAFRRKSLLADVVLGQISGLGWIGYELALKALDHILQGVPEICSI